MDKTAMRRLRYREEYSCKSLADLIALGEKRGYQYPRQWAAIRWGFVKKSVDGKSETV